MKYAVEVAKLGSLNKAAEALLIAQPNISRSIKELEADLGISIFNRSAKGMELTPEGEEFIGYAQNILKQIDEVEMVYKQGSPKKQKFSISVPRACYISDAFAEFSKCLSDDPAEIFYKETNSQRTINNVINNDYKLGIIRYAENYDKYFKAMLEEKGLAYEMVAEFTYVLIMSRDNPLAEKDEITIKPFVYGDVEYFPNVIGIDTQTQGTILENPVVSEVVLTRGWDEPNKEQSMDRNSNGNVKAQGDFPTTVYKERTRLEAAPALKEVEMKVVNGEEFKKRADEMVERFVNQNR
jgi:hypothetical protein